MRKTILVISGFLLCFAPAWGAQKGTSVAEETPEFLARYCKLLEPLDTVYENLETENLPLLDDSGQPVGRHPIENRREALAELRDTLNKLRPEPRNLTLATKLFVQSESLTDDLYDLSQIAYDNDREELGKQLSNLVARLDAERDSIESYTLVLAQEKEARIRRLEAENANLRQQLKQASRAPR
jgi:ABC-type phosphate transport system auxiliary subunit